VTTPTMATDLVGMSQEDWQRALHPSHTAKAAFCKATSRDGLKTRGYLFLISMMIVMTDGQSSCRWNARIS
jgi:hypothetical protein